MGGLGGGVVHWLNSEPPQSCQSLGEDQGLEELGKDFSTQRGTSEERTQPPDGLVDDGLLGLPKGSQRRRRTSRFPEDLVESGELHELSTGSRRSRLA